MPSALSQNKMNKRNIYCLALFTLAITACKDKKTFTIDGVIEHPGALKKVYLLQADSTKISVVDSTNLSENGKFQFQHTSPYANLFKLRAGSTIFDLIAENGDDITFKTNIDDAAHAYDITGSKESEKIKEFNKLSNVYGDKTSKIVAEYQAQVQKVGHQSDSLMNIYKPQFMAVQNQYGQAVVQFINDNTTSLAGFYAATSLDPYQYEQQLVAYADHIKGNFPNNPAVQQFLKQMDLARPVSIGHPAPDFSITAIDNKPVKLADYKGKYVMLDFWASWCSPCRQENPNVVKQYAIYKNKGLNILGISLDEDRSAWQKAIAEDKLTWSHASDLQKFDGPTEKLYHIEAIPSNFIIDPKGIIIAKNITGTQLEEFLNKTFNQTK